MGQVVAHQADRMQDAGRIAGQGLHIDCQVAFCNLGHHLGGVLGLATELVHQGAQHLPRHQPHHQHQHARDGQQDRGVAPEGLLDVIGVVAKTDDPVPGLELDDGVELFDFILGARAGAIGHHQPNGFTLQRRAIAHTRLFAHLGIHNADAFGVGVHIVHIVGEAAHKKVFVLVHKTANRALCLLDRILMRQGAAFFLVVGLLRRGMGQHDQVGQLRCALFQHRLVERIQGHARQHHQAKKGDGSQPENAGFEFHGVWLFSCNPK